MALPLTLTDQRFALRNVKGGPFMASNGAVYIACIGNGDQSDIRVLKGTDPTSAFTEQDASANPNLTNLANSMSADQKSDVLHIAVQEVTTGRLSYHTFDMATDAWVIVNEEVKASITNLPVGGMAVDILARADNSDILIAYQGDYETVSAANYDRVVYARRVSGSWTLDVAMSQTAVARHFRGPRWVRGASGRSHLFWQDRTNNDGYMRHLTSAYSAGTVTTVSTGFGAIDNPFTPGASYDDGGTVRCLIGYFNNTNRLAVCTFDDADNPTLSVTSPISTNTINFVDSTISAAVAFDPVNDTKYAFWGNDSDDDLYYDVDSGGGWGTDTLKQTNTAFHTNIAYYVRAGTPRIGILFESGGSIKYDELDIAVVDPGDVRGASGVRPPHASVWRLAAGRVAAAGRVTPGGGVAWGGLGQGGGHAGTGAAASATWAAGARAAGAARLGAASSVFLNGGVNVAGAAQLAAAVGAAWRNALAAIEGRSQTAARANVRYAASGRSAGAGRVLHSDQSLDVVYSVQVDSERDGLYAAPIDDLTAYVLPAIRWRAGMADAFDEVAQPARMTLVLNNAGGDFYPDTRGAELLTNGDFSAWSGDNPTGWTLTGESGSDPEVNEVGSSELRGGTGTGAANFYSADSDPVSLAQAVLTANLRYEITLVISAQSGGAVRLFSGGVALTPLLQTPGVYTYTFTARGTDMTLTSYGAVNLTLDRVSVKAAAKYAGVFEIGTLARVRATLDGLTYTLFQGKLSDFALSPGVYGDKTVNVTVEDQFWQLLDAEFLPEFEADVTTDVALRQPFERAAVIYPYRENYWVLDAVGSSELDATTVLFGDSEAERALDFDTGYTTIEYVGDNLDRGLGVSAQGFLRDVTAAEAGARFFFDPRAGTYTFHNRGHDLLSLTPQATLTSDDFEAGIYARGADIVNAVTINFEPRDVGAAGSVLWALDDVPFLLEGYSQRRITLRYRDPDDATARVGGMDFIEPLPDTDYAANDAADGSDDNRKRSCVVFVAWGAGGAELIISNTSANGFYVTLLRVRGTPIRSYDRQQVESVAPTSSARFERRERVLDIHSLNDPAFAQSYADLLVNRFKDPLTRLARARFIADKTNARMRRALALGIGSRIAFSDAQTGHSGEYILVGEERAITPGGITGMQAGTHEVLWVLAPANRTQYWIMSDGVDYLATSVLDETTRLML